MVAIGGHGRAVTAPDKLERGHGRARRLSDVAVVKDAIPRPAGEVGSSRAAQVVQAVRRRMVLGFENAGLGEQRIAGTRSLPGASRG